MAELHPTQATHRPNPQAPPETGRALETIAGAVAALPALPSDRPGDRYGLHRLTATWLADLSGHTRTAYFRDLAHFLSWCQHEQLDPCTARATDLSHYRATLTTSDGHTPAPASVHRRMSAISSWYRHLVTNSDGQVSTNPVTGIRRPKVDRDASTTTGLTTSEVRALLVAADQRAQDRAHEYQDKPTPARRTRYLASLRDRALLRVLADLGLRVGEALALDTDALSYNRGRRTVRYLGKGGKRRERPLSAHALEALDDYLATRVSGEPGSFQPAIPELPIGPLFATTSRARPGQAGRLDEPAVFRLIRRLALVAGLPTAKRLSPHSLRHAFATNARELGVALEDVQDAMGHADTRTTRRYDRARFALHRDPALKLGDLYSERDTIDPDR